jgi:hypothetical protein
MTIISKGKVTAALPAPGAAAYQGLVHCIVVSQDPASTGVTTFKQGSNVIRAFNTPAATGSLDQPLQVCDCENSIDPTQFSVGQTVGGEGLFVTYYVL